MLLDVVIIGGGVIGNSLLRELSKYDLNICLVERKYDVAEGASKANSAIVHAGFDPKEGSNKAKFNYLGNRLFKDICEELDVEYKMVGSLVLAFTDHEVSILEKLMEQGKKNGVEGLEIKDKDWVLQKEPNLNKEIKKALYAPFSGITCPYKLTIALFENAIQNGAQVIFGFDVINITKTNDQFYITSKDGRTLRSKIVVNCAGLYSDFINNLVNEEKIEIHPRKGEYYILDKRQYGLVNSVIFQVPTEKGKGILVSPTVDGNILIGPNSNYVEDKEDTSTTKHGLKEVLEHAKLSVPNINLKDVITIFAGNRATPNTHDFIIGESKSTSGFFNAAGIESPGLTSSYAIATYLSNLIVEKLKAKNNEKFNPIRKDIEKISTMDYEKIDELIKKNKSFGKIVCRCEQVSEYEIIEAINRGATNIDAIKRRTRAGMGRCQGGFCSPKIIDILSNKLNIPKEEVTKFGGNSKILYKSRMED
ncbi:NAD(P)/FAD-dependent oxidoreductase [Caldicellulosiruptoraceae bacterium PP1]